MDKTIYTLCTDKRLEKCIGKVLKKHNLYLVTEKERVKKGIFDFHLVIYYRYIY